MTVNSTAPTTSALLSPPRNRPFTNSPFRLAANAAALLAALLSLGMLAQRRSYRRFASFPFVVAMLGALAACGGGGSRSGGGGGGGSTIPGTTVGTYTFTVGGSFTANGAAQAQATVTVTIQ
jgi:hypothetical protein